MYNRVIIGAGSSYGLNTTGAGALTTFQPIVAGTVLLLYNCYYLERREVSSQTMTCGGNHFHLENVQSATDVVEFQFNFIII